MAYADLFKITPGTSHERSEVSLVGNSECKFTF